MMDCDPIFREDITLQVNIFLTSIILKNILAVLSKNMMNSNK